MQNDLTTMAYNTAISALMILTNEMDSKPQITVADYKLLLTLLNPFAPHLTEELNKELGFSPICEGTWPKYDEAKTIDNEIEIPIQVNGKLRGKIMVAANASREEIERLALEKMADHITCGVKKIIYVPGRIFNILV